jgi:hypothetical protein
MAEKCVGITQSGERCTAPKANGGEYCLWHDPDPIKQEQARVSRIKGGLNRRVSPQLGDYPETIKTAQQLLEYINAALADCKQIEGHVQRLTVTASLLRIACEILPIVDTAARLEIVESLLYKEGVYGKT